MANNPYEHRLANAQKGVEDAEKRVEAAKEKFETSKRMLALIEPLNEEARQILYDILKVEMTGYSDD